MKSDTAALCSGFLAPLLALTLLAVTASSTAGQTQPRFQMGFKLLADSIPDAVGEPLEQEHYNPLNGDAVQQTTRGLMVWRCADNWTAFTNGSRSWINGPLGLQERGNDERFDWEVTPARGPTAPMPGPTGMPTPTPVPKAVRSADPSGQWVTSASSSTKFYTSRDNSYWRSWSAHNRVWFATEADLLAAYPGRIRR